MVFVLAQILIVVSLQTGRPTTMVKDHRTRFSVGNIQAVMDGDLDDFMNAYLVAKWKGLPMDGSGDDDEEV